MEFQMNKGLTVVCCVVVFGVMWWAGTMEPVVKDAVAESSGEPVTEMMIRVPRGRVLYVVVDQDGVYLGTQRIERRFAKAAIETLLKKERIRNLLISATDLARYGDVVELYASIDRSLLTWISFSTRAETIGTRKPLTGYYRPACCYADDIENSDHRHEHEEWR